MTSCSRSSAALASRQSDPRTTGCVGAMRYSTMWATRLPADLPLYPDAQVAESAGNADGTGAAASFNAPYGVAVDGGGNVYVADQDNGEIRKITPTGVVTTLAGSGSPGNVNGAGATASFLSPTGVAVDSSGNVYVADYGNNEIREITMQQAQ